jgi:hypothetical protein
MKTESKKFHFAEVKPKPCSPVEAEKHLRAFAASFIDKNYTDRWIHITIEKPEKAKYEMHKLERHLNPTYCKMMADVEAFPVSLAEAYGSKQGVYFDGTEPAQRMTAPEAASLAEERNVDAMFSIAAGKLAIFFFHEGWAWKCER